MKTRERWIDEARMEIEGYRAIGEEVTLEMVKEEVEGLYGSDPDMDAAIDAEGGTEEYVKTLWNYIEKERKVTE